LRCIFGQWSQARWRWCNLAWNHTDPEAAYNCVLMVSTICNLQPPHWRCDVDLDSNAPATSLAEYAALFADIYEKMGGQITWVGKPYSQIYRSALTLLNNPNRTLCIGDSAEHDVVGGKNASLTTLLVQQGVLAHLSQRDLELQPDFICSKFCW
jgi:ribonucleotide monophosphatase NagD (HAD superfamily)